MLMSVQKVVDMSCCRSLGGFASEDGRVVMTGSQSYPLAGDLGSLNPGFRREVL